MADFMRTPKPGNLWLPSDLEAFNIKIVEQDIQTFFGIANLPTPNVSPIIWNNVVEPLMAISKAEKNFFAYLNDAMQSCPPNEKSMTIDFAVFLLKMLEYDVGRRVIHTRKTVGFKMCNVDVNATADVSVMNKNSQSPDSSRLILVQGDKSSGSVDLAPQLIAAAIAVCKAETQGHWYKSPERELQNLAGITMFGTAPQLYKIKFSRKFLDCVYYGQYPEQTTIVKKLSLPSELADYHSDVLSYIDTKDTEV